MAFLIGGANSAADTGYTVANSCRFNDGDSAEITRTLGTPTNADKFTLSMWVKRGIIAAAEMSLFVAASSDSQGDLIRFTSGDAIEWQMYHGGATAQYITNRKFRDPSAWYHLVFTYDSGNATAGDRMKIYVNGVEETSFATSTDVAVNTDSKINSAIEHSIGQDGASGISTPYFDGYMAEVVLCDGQTYAASDFGEFDEDSPQIWKPKDPSGLTFGTNGFYLDFEASDNLGNDANGGTDWAEVNIAAADQATDTPTNNWCVLNPLDTHASATLSEGNTEIATTASGWYGGSGTIGITLGQPAYFEAKAISSARLYFGLSRIGQGVRGTCLNSSAEGSSDFDYMWRTTTANTVFYGGSNQSITISVISANDICACSVASDGEVIFYKNDATVVTFSTKLVAGYTYFPILAANAYGGGTESWQANFGNPAYAITSTNTDPDGYGNFEFATKSAYAINTKNLAEYG